MNLLNLKNMENLKKRFTKKMIVNLILILAVSYAALSFYSHFNFH